MTDLIQLRGDTAANWAAANPVLAARELVIETDKVRTKIGDGVTAYNSLPYTRSGLGPEAYPIITGLFYGDPHATGANLTTPTAGRLEMRPFPVGVDASFDQLVTEVTTIGTCVYRVGIYDSDPTTGKPRTLVADGGTVAAATTGGIRTNAIAANLKRGLYWLAALGDVAGTGAFRSWGTQAISGRLGWSTGLSSGALHTELIATGVAVGSLPATAPAMTGFATTTGIRLLARAS